MPVVKEPNRKLKCVAVSEHEPKGIVRDLKIDGEIVAEKVKVGDVIEVPVSQGKILSMRPYLEIVKETPKKEPEKGKDEKKDK